MPKVILLLSDALRYDAAVAGMGYLGHLVETRRASLYKVNGELPSMSRPMYETLHTGALTIEHGIVSNLVVRRSNLPNVFQLAVQAGLTTAACAYYWFSELYNRLPYDAVNDREVDDPALAIQHGRFYRVNDFPDIECFDAAAMLARRFNPDYLLVHPMGMDYTGEKYGADSPEYRNLAVLQDMWLAAYLAEWLERGYNILVTGDHGINADCAHGGTTPEMREVPLYLIRPGVDGRGKTGETLSQLQIAPTLCRLLGLAIPDTMRAAPLV
ncbi:MAG: alkaline phosphatase family protein [Chloroflexi bacterium]|nr:alkaline phosphatase family protein [Chloroflexota bacterium]